MRTKVFHSQKAFITDNSPDASGEPTPQTPTNKKSFPVREAFGAFEIKRNLRLRGKCPVDIRVLPVAVRYKKNLSF